MEKKVIKKAVTDEKAETSKKVRSKTTSSATATSPVKKRAAKTVKAQGKPARVTDKAVTKERSLDVTAEIAAAEPVVELSPAFKALAEPVLPELPRENRARLMMQTPTELYFYWSVRENPYHLLHNIFGEDTGSYTLVLKLTNLNTNEEEIYPAEAEGNWWFRVEPAGKYEAEIGFYAPNRPYFRIIYSNTVETPRRTPSPQPATDADWYVSANKFAEVLDVAGFTQDAVDVAMTGDDHYAADAATHTALSRFAGLGAGETVGIAAEDIRYALMALAAGAQLEEMRSRINSKLFGILQANVDKLAADKAMSALTEYFDIDEAEFTEEQFGSAVYGASLVNFPRTLRTRSVGSKFAPVSSHSYR